MSDISKIKLPSGQEFTIKDATARDSMEVKSNKVTALDSASTDSQYPSAKAAYDMVQAAIASIAIPSRYNATTNPNGYLTLSDLPIYDGSVT